MECECGKSAENGDKFCRVCGQQLSEEEVFSCECGAEVLKSDKFCHECGAPFSTAGACECGSALIENARFCHSCGKEILQPELPETAEAPVEMPEIAAEESKGYYRQNQEGSFTFVKGKQPSDQ